MSGEQHNPGDEVLLHVPAPDGTLRTFRVRLLEEQPDGKWRVETVLAKGRSTYIVGFGDTPPCLVDDPTEKGYDAT